MATLVQWKQLAERVAYNALEHRASAKAMVEPDTLVALGYRIVFMGIWVGGSRDCWKFRVRQFIRGDLQLLRDEISHASGLRAFEFIVAESQGDGRLVAGDVEWRISSPGEGEHLEISVPVHPRAPRRDPASIGADFALGDDGDLLVENGDLKLVQGIEAAVQQVSMCLGCLPGEPLLHPEYGSLATLYYRMFADQPLLLARLFALEVARLATIPLASGPEWEEEPPPLNFIWRVNSVNVPRTELDGDRLATQIELIWSNGDRWSGTIAIFIAQDIQILPGWLRDPRLPSEPLRRRDVGPLPSADVNSLAFGAWTSSEPGSD